MTARHSGTRAADGGLSPPDAGERIVEDRPLPWLLRQKVAVPDRVTGYFDRAALVSRAMPTRHRLTVLMAPGGFGKTTLLAECCRRLRGDGIPVAWVSVDEKDEAAILDTYTAYACRSATAHASAGVESLGMSALGLAGRETGGRTEFEMREVEARDGPFVLVFDEVERLGSPDTVALLDFLLQRGPPNLHLALACRELPVGLNIAGAVLDGHATVLSADDLRFSSSEVAAFFDGKLSGSQLDAVMSESAGWALALRISRNEMEKGAGAGARASRNIVENWVQSRLLTGLGMEDREFLLDIALFEWMDAALLDEVLERSDSMRRIDTMPVLDGLLEPVRDGATDVWRLHPLIREHCVRRRFRETPQRFRTVHRRIAGAVARRGQTVAAMRHAVEAGEPALAGDILEGAGGVGLYLRGGVVQFQAAARLLGEDVGPERPQLALVRCLSSILSGRMQEARERYDSVSGLLQGLDPDESDAALELAANHLVVLGMIALYGSERFGSALIRTLLADIARLGESPRIDASTRGHLEYSLCIAGNMTADFKAALDHAERARRCFAESRYMSMFTDIQEGQAAMAQGRVRDAAALYRRARRAARQTYVRDTEPAAICEGLLRELALECGVAAPDADPARVPRALATGSTSFQAYAAAAGACVDQTLRDKGVAAALAAAEEMLDYVRAARLPALERYLSALGVSLLATAGRIGDGEQAWESDGLPDAAADCLDLTCQTWREMEALSCARLRLTIRRGHFEEARSFAEELRAVAEARGLKRTLIRALALSTVLEVRAGAAEAAAGHLKAYLGLYAGTPYAGPLVREREDCAALLAEILADAPDSPTGKAARSLLGAMERANNGLRPALSAREWEVLQRLGSQQDKQIAAELGMTAYGVRYHIRKLFAKLGAHSRAEALRRAREVGLVPGEY
ncbi:MAG: LuxR C-terminal-related transcriptional regulator [Thiotrichales bacterium]|nr:LuxR C-terminal-related transcriptional regulator [Thiotrichales bacterium]